MYCVFLRYGSSDRPAGTIPLNLLGMVGGHCIPVGPYYLVQKAREIGYHPQVITCVPLSRELRTSTVNPLLTDMHIRFKIKDSR